MTFEQLAAFIDRTYSDPPANVELFIELQKAIALTEQARVLSVIATSLENIDNALRDYHR